jgi:hypothetical protein
MQKNQKLEDLYKEFHKDDGEIARMAAFIRVVSEIIQTEFVCEWWEASDAAMGRNSRRIPTFCSGRTSILQRQNPMYGLREPKWRANDSRCFLESAMILEKVERWSRAVSKILHQDQKGRVIAKFDSLNDVRRWLLFGKVWTKHSPLDHSNGALRKV